VTNVTNVQSHCCATRFFFQSYRRKVVQGSLLGCFFFLDCQVNFSAIGWTVQRKCDSCIHSSWLLTDHQVTDTWNHHDVLISLVLPRLVRRTVTFVISKIDYHIFSPLDQYRSGNDPHHPRCPRYVINGSALSTRTSWHLPRGLLFNLLHDGLLWSHIITLSSSLTWQKHDAQRNDRKIEGYVALPHWTVLMYSCPNTSHFWCFLLGLLSREFQNHRVPVLIW